MIPETKYARSGDVSIAYQVTGEIELIGEDVGGIAVHTAARVLGNAGANEVWGSRTVKDLVAGSGFEFNEQGVYTLKGITGEWRLFTVER